MDAFVRAYIGCALGCMRDEEGNELDGQYNVHDIAQEAINRIADDCEKFQKENAEDIGTEYEQAGHDFWLTRNHHGVGFWDRSDDIYPKAARDRLTEAAHAFGETDLYVGDDGKLYME